MSRRPNTPSKKCWNTLAASPKTQWYRYSAKSLREAAGALMGKKPSLACQLAQLAAKKAATSQNPSPASA